MTLAQELEGNTQSKYIAPVKRLNKVVGLAKNAIVAQLVYNKFNAIKPTKKMGEPKPMKKGSQEEGCQTRTEKKSVMFTVYCDSALMIEEGRAEVNDVAVHAKKLKCNSHSCYWLHGYIRPQS